MTGYNSVVDYVCRRETNGSITRKFQKDLHVTDNFIGRLGLEKELEGHFGCVNCLEWDSKGQILASASDDLQVIIWDPFRYKKLQSMQTGHNGNIFSVKLLSGVREGTLITGAGDFEVRVHNIVCRETTKVCVCHGSRVKRLATAPDQPDLFWSAAEDGIIRQFDLRNNHRCFSEQNVLVNLRFHAGEHLEAKCLSVNPLRTEIIAVGANDPYIRIYDRRMIKLTKAIPSLSSTNRIFDTEDNLPKGCVQYFVPGHVSCKRKYPEREARDYSATYITFGPNGTDLLVNLGSEQIYLFDTTTKSQNVLLRQTNDNKELGEPLSGYCNGYHPERSRSIDKSLPQLPEHINKLKLMGNSLFDQEQYTKSINIYNEAIKKFPVSSVFYSNRAAAYMKRDWCGDMYGALRDCLTALIHDAGNVKAFFRMARCLFELSWYPEAQKCLDNFKKRFPGHSKSTACVALERDITSKIKRKVQSPNERPENEFRVTTGQELEWREAARDYMLRFYGHCNTTTDIKEANFFGSSGQYIVAGSDDGSIFLWDSATTNNVRILKGDSSVVNCLQPHPTYCLLATSGIEHVVRLWSPKPQDGKENELEVKEREEVAQSNQRRMTADPFDVVLMNMGLTRPDYEAYHQTSTNNCRAS